MNTAGYILSFAAGCVVGALATYRLASDKAEERADMEIAEMEKYFESKYERKKKKTVVDSETKKKAEAAHNKPSIDEIKKKAEEAVVNYTAYSENVKTDDLVIHSVEPVILQTEEEFGEIEEYNREYLIYFADSVLADSITRIVYDRQDTIDAVGLEALKEFDKLTSDGQPKDLVWVRNDRLRTYFEIERSEDEYSAVGWEDDEEY